MEFCSQIKAGPATASIPILPLFLGPVEAGVRGAGEAGNNSLAADVEPRALIDAIETLLRVRVTREQFQGFLEAAPDAVVITPPAGKIDQTECMQCLDCMILYYDDHACPPLVKERKSREKSGQPLTAINGAGYFISLDSVRQTLADKAAEQRTRS